MEDTRKTEDLNPYEVNPRIITEAAIAAVVKSIEIHEQVRSIVISEKGHPFDREVICCGHTTLEAIKRIGITEVKVDVHKFKDVADFNDLNVRDNKSAEFSGWDFAELGNSFDIDEIQGLGFNDQELGLMFNEADGLQGNTDPDDLPPEANPVCNEGDLFGLGNHLLRCGDSTKPPPYRHLFEKDTAEMVWTDPPYNVDYVGGPIGAKKDKIQNDNLDDIEFRKFLSDAFKLSCSFTKKGGAIYICHSSIEVENFVGAMKQSGWLYKQCLIWVKNQIVLGRTDYKYKHEPILYGWRAGAAHRWRGAFDKPTVIDDDVNLRALDKKELMQIIKEFRNNQGTDIIREEKPTKSDLHTTMKPVALIKLMINNSSKEGETVLDPFGGSGSTLIACEQLKRKARVIEINAKYCDKIIKRWEDFTGEKANKL